MRSNLDASAEADRAAHERSQSPLSPPPRVGVPSAVETHFSLVREAIRDRDAAWLVHVMHDYDQIPGGEFHNRYPQVIRCMETSPIKGCDAPFMTFLKMAAGLHYVAAIATEAGTAETPLRDALRKIADEGRQSADTYGCANCNAHAEIACSALSSVAGGGG